MCMAAAMASTSGRDAGADNAHALATVSARFRLHLHPSSAADVLGAVREQLNLGLLRCVRASGAKAASSARGVRSLARGAAADGGSAAASRAQPHRRWIARLPPPPLPACDSTPPSPAPPTPSCRSFNEDLGGVVLAYSGERVTSRAARLHPYFPFLAVTVTAAVTLFRPRPGQRLGVRARRARPRAACGTAAATCTWPVRPALQRGAQPAHHPPFLPRSAHPYPTPPAPRPLASRPREQGGRRLCGAAGAGGVQCRARRCARAARVQVQARGARPRGAGGGGGERDGRLGCLRA